MQTSPISDSHPRRAPGSPAGQKGLYRPELDMLRLLACSSVFFAHGVQVNFTGGLFLRIPALALTIDILHRIGIYGLPLFFFLSSFLITSLLTVEQARTGTVHLRNFYVRRVLRIWPLYFGFLAVAYLIGLFWQPLYCRPSLMLSYVLVYSNWYLIFTTLPPLSVAFLWSIAVEEQFYLIWPGLVRRLSRRGIRNLSIGMAGLSLLCIGVSAAHGTQIQTWFNSGAQMIFLAGGALFSLQVGLREQRRGSGRALAAIGCGIGLWLLAQIVANQPTLEKFVSPERAMLDYLLVCLGCASLLFGFLSMPRSWVRRRLVYLGRISYGIYVFQGLALVVGEDLLARSMRGGSWLVGSVVIAVTLAMLSYEFYEKPFLRLKRRFEFVHSRPA